MDWKLLTDLFLQLLTSFFRRKRSLTIGLNLLTLDLNFGDNFVSNHGVHPPPPLSSGKRGGLGEPPIKFSKRAGLTGTQLLEGG